MSNNQRKYALIASGLMVLGLYYGWLLWGQHDLQAIKPPTVISCSTGEKPIGTMCPPVVTNPVVDAHPEIQGPNANFGAGATSTDFA